MAVVTQKPSNEEIKKRIRSALIAGSALAITQLSQWALGLDYGPYTAVVVAVLTFIVNEAQMAVRRYSVTTITVNEKLTTDLISPSDGLGVTVDGTTYKVQRATVTLEDGKAPVIRASGLSELAKIAEAAETPRPFSDTEQQVAELEQHLAEASEHLDNLERLSKRCSDVTHAEDCDCEGAR